MEDSFDSFRGKWSIKFRRRMNTGDANDKVLKQYEKNYMLYAIGTLVAGAPPTLNQHTHRGVMEIYFDNNIAAGLATGLALLLALVG